MRNVDVAKHWNDNADQWTRDVRAGFDVYRDHFTFPAFLDALPPINGLGELDTASEIRKRFGGGSAARETKSPAAAAAARAAKPRPFGCACARGGGICRQGSSLAAPYSPEALRPRAGGNSHK